jgi:hypothetical protein
VAGDAGLKRFNDGEDGGYQRGRAGQPHPTAMQQPDGGAVLEQLAEEDGNGILPLGLQ